MDEVKRTFTKVINIIESAKKNAYRKVNEELINMYWRVGKFISEEAKTASYGDSFIDELSRYIQDTFPGIKGFNRRGLYRMKQFYEVYANYEKVSPLVTQINWTNNLLILIGTKSIEEKEFYLRLSFWLRGFRKAGYRTFTVTDLTDIRTQFIVANKAWIWYNVDPEVHCANFCSGCILMYKIKIE